ncbi:alpha/beta fold hydrolase [Rhizobium mayense]|uniref:Alpha/beta fold hydrolase n=1 Tax=Rhizobium mayense TaxID=1312184 RepID=A0ABT7K892_9HYPH|nr:alpha/beta fold hydrolase [Rhizobium mayense]MDL2403643.1 alpha/beta fold hydrolase [Rhizobium mayense]
MTVFVLVHGAWHGGWCWEEVTPLLEASGHKAYAPDLPGLGEDLTPPAEVSLARCAGRISELLATISEPVVLVGHSAGGPVISQVAEYGNNRIFGLIYVGAHLLPSGDSMVTANERSIRPQADAELIVMQPDGSALVNPEIARSYFYGKCSPDRVERALARLRPQSLALFTDPVQAGNGFAHLPRGYVETADDAALFLQQQRDMQAALPCRPVITLASDHSPFFSMPDRLAAALIQIAEEFTPGNQCDGSAYSSWR